VDPNDYPSRRVPRANKKNEQTQIDLRLVIITVTQATSAWHVDSDRDQGLTVRAQRVIKAGGDTLLLRIGIKRG